MRMVRFLCTLCSKKKMNFPPYIKRWFVCAGMRFHLKGMFTLPVIYLEQRKWEASVPFSWKIILKGALFPKLFHSFKVTYNDFIMAQWLWPISSWKERVTRSWRNRNEKAFEAKNQKNISKLPQREKCRCLLFTAKVFSTPTSKHQSSRKGGVSLHYPGEWLWLGPRFKKARSHFVGQARCCA